MEGERPAASLRRRRHDLAPLRRQYPRGSGIHMREEDALHTPGQHPNSPTDRPLRGGQRRHRRGILRQVGGQRLHRPQPLRQQLPDRPLPHQLLQPQRLVRPQPREHHLQPLRIGEEPEDEVAEHPVGASPLVPSIDLLARRLDQLVVLHAARAGGDARETAEALIEVADHLIGHRLTFEPLGHQVDAAARRVHLLPPQDIRGTRRKTEATMHAIIDEILRRRMMAVEGRGDDIATLRASRPDRRPVGRFGTHPDAPRQIRSPTDDLRRGLQMGRFAVLPVCHQMPPTNRPGFRMLSGSNRNLTRRMRSSLFPTGPQTSRSRLTGIGARGTVT